PLTGLAEALLGLDRPAEALPLAERAAAIREKNALPAELAESRFALARARWATGDRARALAVARQARDGFAGAGALAAPQAAEVDAWLAARAR
ncbi:MAG TPA: tetratricopeptide repeat protein, partial [Kofleriaceae bacterium]|nr:tetratricopeptide repeat protein [Kofleriaceae bacterium]